MHRDTQRYTDRYTDSTYRYKYTQIHWSRQTDGHSDFQKETCTHTHTLLPTHTPTVWENSLEPLGASCYSHPGTVILLSSGPSRSPGISTRNTGWESTATSIRTSFHYRCGQDRSPAALPVSSTTPRPVASLPWHGSSTPVTATGRKLGGKKQTPQTRPDLARVHSQIHSPQSSSGPWGRTGLKGDSMAPATEAGFPETDTSPSQLGSVSNPKRRRPEDKIRQNADGRWPGGGKLSHRARDLGAKAKETSADKQAQ